MRDQYEEYIFSGNVPRSGKASSYMKALDLLNRVLNDYSTLYANPIDVWAFDIQEIGKLYQYAIDNQKLEGSEFLHKDLPSSYGKSGYYSAALRSFGEFLTSNAYEQELGSMTSGAGSAEEFVANAESVGFEPSVFIPDAKGDGNTEQYRQAKVRTRQSFFRKQILKNYNCKCAITGLSIPQVLRASHITRWADDEKNRLNPSNGICLSATFDAAFDRHIISFDEEYRVLFGAGLAQYADKEAFQKHIAPYKGQALTQPTRFLPDPELLRKHREMFRKISNQD